MLAFSWHQNSSSCCTVIKPQHHPVRLITAKKLKKPLPLVMRKTLRGFYRPFRCPQNASLRHPCIILSTFSKNVDLLWRLSRSLPRPINLKAQRVDVRSFSVQPHFKNLTFSLPKQFHILQRTLVVKCFWCTCRSSRRRKHAEAPCHCGQRTVMEMGLLLHNHLQGLWPLPCCSTSSAADQSSGRARLYVTPPPHSLPAKCDTERARIIMPLIAPCIPFRWVQVSQQHFMTPCICSNSISVHFS